jgi:hypothetical protein
LVITSLSPNEVSEKAIQHMAAKNYKLISGSDNILIFEDGSAINWILFTIYLFIFLLIGAVIYLLLADKHRLTLTVSATEAGTKVQATTNSNKSRSDSTEFLNLL